VLPIGRQVEAGAGIVGAGIEIEQRQHVQVGRQEVEDLLVLGEDGQESVAPPRRLAPQDARCVVGVAGDVLMAFGGWEDELRIAGDQLVRIAPPGSRRGWRADRWRHWFPVSTGDTLRTGGSPHTCRQPQPPELERIAMGGQAKHPDAEMRNRLLQHHHFVKNLEGRRQGPDLTRSFDARPDAASQKRRLRVMGSGRQE
jgi:hypothetical protein